MKKHLTITSVLLSATLLFSTSISAETLRIGVEGAYPPFSKTDKDGKLSGFDIEIGEALCESMGRECKLVKQDWDGMIPALMARKFDAILASMSITEERKKKVDFTNYYYKAAARFIHKKGGDHEISKAGLKGKSVGVQRGTIHDKFVTGTYGEDVNVKRYGTQEEAYLDLTAGRLDFMLADGIVLTAFLGSDKGKDFEFIGGSYSDPKYFGVGVGIAIRKGDTLLGESFNKAIKEIRANGTYDSIRKKYFSFDIYGEE